jgi:hypothetical protein
MNTPESITVDLEHAKKLKAAGWPQEDSVMCWCVCKPETDCFVWKRSGTEHKTDFAAPTAEEILRRLPDYIVIPVNAPHKHEHRFLKINKDSTGMGNGYQDFFYVLGYGPVDHGFIPPEWSCSDRSIANAASAMYCYLAAHKLLP